ncbi:unnamed protein product [Sphagnum balticum]
MEDRGDVVVGTSVFSDCFSPEVPKISAVYKRREKKKDENQKPPLAQQQQSAVASTALAAFNARRAADNVFVYTDEVYENKDRHVPKKLLPRSWNNRSLSFRGRRSSILSSERLPLSAISSNGAGDTKAQQEGDSTDSNASVSCKPHTIELKGNLQGQSHSRQWLPHNKPQRPWAGVSLAFVKEQQAFFADIDAFNLDEKEVYFGPSPQEPEEDRMEPQAAQDELSNFHHPNKPLEAVPEEGSAKITSQMLDDLLTAALVTPQPSYLQTGCKNVPVQMSPKSAFTQGFPTSRTVLCTSFGFPKLSLFSKLLDSEQAIPSPETLRDETSRQSLPGACSRLSFSANYRASEEGLFFDSQSLISGLESLQIREEDNQVDCSKIDLCTPILEEDNCLGAISEEEFPGGKVANDDDKDADGHMVETEFLSVFDTLLRECAQGQQQSLREAISEFCDLEKIVKLGEGTYGEAFKGGGNVFKIVPMDGDFHVNGEIQKTSAEILSEVLLHNTLNKLRGDPTSFNMCTNFIHTKATRICQGTYDSDLVHAWEDYDATRTSENEHPMLFPDKQLYVVFVLADGGQDLESFVLADFDEARSVLFQVVLALAVAEEAFQFEHRDLHWGNLVLARCKEPAIPYRLLGQSKLVKSFGISLSLIDFTLSRLDTGKQVQFTNLSADPVIFEGPKGDIQFDTYRRMLKLTKGQWEGRFLKTNCLWIHYLADILLSKKSFSCSEQEKRSLRAFRKRVLLYECAGAAVQDDFFDGMLLDSLE